MADPKKHRFEDHDTWYVQFDDGTVIECNTELEAEGLAEAWKQWPASTVPPVEEKRGAWRTGFADGVEWLGRRHDDALGLIDKSIDNVTDLDITWSNDEVIELMGEIRKSITGPGDSR